MLAYVSFIQRRERELGTDVLTHQKVRDCEVARFSILIRSNYCSGLAPNT